MTKTTKIVGGLLVAIVLFAAGMLAYTITKKDSPANTNANTVTSNDNNNNNEPLVPETEETPDTTAPTPPTFIKSGTLTRNNPGQTKDVWYLTYEAPGQPAVSLALKFTNASTCSINKAEADCDSLTVKNGTKASVSGADSNGVITVESLDIPPATTVVDDITTAANGTIEGSLSYPSEGIPATMKVCAVNTITKKEACTTTQIKDKKYDYGVGYKLSVPAGTYNVYATVDNKYKAYYNEYVTCGLKASCTSHKTLNVTVTADKTTGNIDPQDWYNQ